MGVSLSSFSGSGPLEASTPCRWASRPRGAPWASGIINRQIRKAVDACPDDEIPAWKKYGDAAYKRLSFHSWRHTARSIMAALDIPLHVIDAVVGHGSRKQRLMSFHYTAVPDKVLIDAARTTVQAFETAYAAADKKASSG